MVSLNDEAARGFSVLFVRIKNILLIRAQHGEEAASAIMASCLERLKGAAAAGDTVGCWHEGVLCAIGSGWQKGEAEFARDLAWKLRGKHGVSLGKNRREIEVQAASVALKREPGETVARTLARVEEALRVL